MTQIETINVLGQPDINDVYTTGATIIYDLEMILIRKSFVYGLDDCNFQTEVNPCKILM